MRSGAISPRTSVEERAARLQRRYAGPWRTMDRQLGPVVVTHRYRRRTRIEWLRLGVALRDMERAFWAGAAPIVASLAAKVAQMTRTTHD